jgi:TonB family protein
MSIGRTFIAVLAFASTSLVFAQTTEAKQPDVSGSVSPNPIGNEAIALTKAEILTDAMGANLGPYITQVTEAVRQNWYSILPPSVYPPMRKQGKLSIEFVILKDGKVTDMVADTSSGDVELDRAAWGSITASAFLPLPTEFPGQQLKVRLHYFYNLAPGIPATLPSNAVGFGNPVGVQSLLEEARKQTAKREYQLALASLGRALELSRSLKDRNREVQALTQLGDVYHTSGQPEKALEFLKQALPILREIADRRGEAITLNRIGIVYRDTGQPQNALEFYNLALSIFRDVGDHREEANTMVNIGGSYRSIGQSQKALEFFNKAFPISRGLGDRNREAFALEGIGGVYADTGQPQKALECLKQALTFVRDVGNRREEAAVLITIGDIYRRTGEPQNALAFYNLALPRARELGDRRSEVMALNDIGWTYANTGQPEKALEFTNQALSLTREVGERRGEVDGLNESGDIYRTIGELQKALEFLNRALLLARELGYRRGEAYALNDIGLVYRDIGQPQKALEFLNQALPILQETGNHIEEANTLDNIGSIYRAMGQPQKALETFRQALPISRELGDRRREAYALEGIGGAYRNMGQPQKALEFLNQSLSISREIGNRREEAFTLDMIGEIQRVTGQPEGRADSLQLYLTSLQLAQMVGDPDLQGGINRSLMRYWTEKNVSLAIFFGKAAVNDYQQIRRNMRGLDQELQAGFAQSKSQSYRQLAELLAQQGRLAEAEQVLNLLKEAEYFDFVRRDSAESASLTQHADLTPVEAGLDKRYRGMEDKLVALGTERGVLLSKKDLTPEETKRLTQLDRDLQEGNLAFEKFLNDLEGQFAGAPVAKAQIEQLRETQGLMEDLRELPQGTVAIYTLVGEDKYRAILITPEVQKGYEYPIKAADLNRKVLEFRQTLQNPLIDPRPLGQELYQILVASLANDLRQANTKTVMWSLDGALRYLPVAALYDGSQYLVEQYAMSVFTPASNARLKDRPDRRWQAAGFGVTRAYEGAPALPEVAAELSGIIEQKTGQGGILAGEIKLDDQFTEDIMRQTLLKHYAVVHIASHFRFEPGNETDSFLLLGDGNHLSLAELKSLPNLFGGVQLLTLSACNTGVGDANADGKEVEGFGVLAQRKGAKAVVASLWPVVDVSTSALMQEFYRVRESSETTKAEALRLAQLALLRGTLKPTNVTSANRALMHEPVRKESDPQSRPFESDPKSPYAHPYFWAPFFLMGNWL